MKVFNILDPNTNIFQSRCLEASAGTGKTFAIEHLFVRFLLESNPPINLSQILAVTFTRDATNEMKTRIRKNLEGIQHSHLPYLENYSNSKETLKKVKDALIQIDELQVFTIHGFCHRMLREFSLEANVNFISSIDQYHHESAMRKIVEDFLQNENSAFSHEMSIVLSKMRFDTDRLIVEIIKEMQKKEETSKKIDWCEIFSSFADNNFQPSRFAQDFITLAPRYKRLNPEHYMDQVEMLAVTIKSQGSQGIINLLQQKSWFLEKMHEENVKVKAPSLETQALHYPGLYAKLQKILLPKLIEARDAKQCLKIITAECRRRWEIKSSISEQLSPDDLLHKMKQALEKEVFREAVRNKYRVVVVDEFQDTDPVQWGIFQTLFHHPKCFLYLVGDPKQSIYGFRSADIYTYIQATEKLENKAFLDTNFRSNPQLIDALNALFTKVPDWMHLPKLSLNYHPVKAGREKGQLQESPLQFFFTNAEQGKEKNWPPKSIEEKTLFPFIASEIIHLNNQSNVNFGEIAILVKDRFQAKRLEQHLRKWNLPTVVQRSLHIAETKGFFVMKQLLRAAISAEESLNGVLLLLGFSPQEIEKNLQYQGQIRALFSLLREKSFGVFFAQLLQEKFGDQSIYEFLVQNHGVSFFLEFQQIAELLMEKFFAHPADLIQWMEDLKDISPDENPHLKFHGEKGNDKINILTVFASKGLEFEIVFALGIATSSSLEQQEEEKEAEKMRELYVAVTRAREKVYLLFVFQEEKNIVANKDLSALEVFFAKIAGYPVSSESICNFLRDLPVAINWIKEIAINPIEQKTESLKLIPPKHLSLNFPIKTLASFSSLSTAKSKFILNELYLSQDLNEKTLHTLPLGTETGIIIHTIFERVFSERDRPIKDIVQEELKRSSLADWDEVIEQVLQEMFNLPLIDSFALKDLAPGKYYQEMEFLFSEGNQFIKGFADLIFAHEEKYYLLDWKTNWLGIEDADYNQTNIVKAMHEHDYFLQAKLYAEALRRYVKLFDNRPFDTCFGGAIYVFLRGKKAYNFNPYEMD